MSTESDVYDVIAQLMDAYPDWSPRNLDATMRSYASMLADLPADALRAAANELIGSSKWFPKISELRAAAKHHADRAADPTVNKIAGYWRSMEDFNCRVLHGEMDLDTWKTVHPAYIPRVQ